MKESTGTTAEPCPEEAELLRLMFQGKWRLLILQQMLAGPVRLSELKRAIPECTKKMLVENLHSLRSLGWIDRHEFASRRRRVEYTFSPACAETIRHTLDSLASSKRIESS